MRFYPKDFLPFSIYRTAVSLCRWQGLFLLGVVLAFTGCKLHQNPDLPAYVHIARPKLVLRNPQTGLLDTVQGLGIVPDVWVLQENDLLGPFEAPVTLPTTDLTKTRFFTLGGVWRNGTATDHSTYVFWTADTSYVTLRARDTAFIQPVLRYRPDSAAHVGYIEDFEGSGVKLQVPDSLTDNPPATFEHNNPFEGHTCYHIQLTADKPIWTMMTQPAFLPHDTPLWVEISYRGNAKVGVMLRHYTPGDVSGQYIPVYTPGSPIVPEAPADLNTWQTTYYDFRPMIAQSLLGSAHNVMLVAALPEGRESGDLYIDNIRIVWIIP